ncbi:hypothetical protein [Marinifilum flexuosum]|uniref:hypothetical protein n=1 Tax=Marinifilum flexuosum TaxID=1117708 RepID=UPI0024943422|nr:hypothetical protein [Marinifilum flexuosum]
MVSLVDKDFLKLEKRFMILSVLMISLFLSLNSYAQDRRRDLDYYSKLTKKVVNNTSLDRFGRKGKTVGSCYWNEQWRKADILLVTDSILIGDVESRIDIRRNELEVKYKGEIKVIPSFRINALQFIGDTGVYTTEGALKVREKGFYSILVQGKNTLLCGAELEIIKANYNIALGVGNKHDTMIKKDKFFIYCQEDSLIHLETSKGKLRKQFKETPIVSSYLKKNKINPRNKKELIQFVNFLNKNNVSIN